MRFLKGIFAVAVALTALSANNNANAQTVVFNGLGSSAMFNELGEAAALSSLGASCVWTATSGGGFVFAQDTSVPGHTTPATSLNDVGQAFVAWTPVAGSCSGVGSTVYAYLQTDSVIGDRCLSNAQSSTCKIVNNGSGQTTGNVLSAVNSSITEQPTLPSVIATALNAAAVNVAGADIRPEDAVFAETRARTACGTAVVTGSQYLGLGYNNGDSIDGFYDPTSIYHVIDFTLPTGFSVTSLGATPVVVVINSDGTHNGLGDPNITNLSSGTLANFLDGSYSRSQDAVLPGVALTGTSASVNVVIREPLSGTYNTMEFNDPNTLENQTSQDVGLLQSNVGTGESLQRNCNASHGVLSNPMHIETHSGGFRSRAIGTGDALKAVFNNANTMGYGFWSVANFKAAPATTRYVTVDGVDPLLNAYTTGVIPTGTALEGVTLSGVRFGNYPIWTLLRLVAAVTPAPSGVTGLATAAQNFVSFGGTGTPVPDFVPVASTTFPAFNLKVVRSHFVPTGQTLLLAAANGTGAAAENGGDVGGVVYPVVGDTDYIADFQGPLSSTKVGETGRRR